MKGLVNGAKVYNYFETANVMLYKCRAAERSESGTASEEQRSVAGAALRWPLGQAVTRLLRGASLLPIAHNDHSVNITEMVVVFVSDNSPDTHTTHKEQE